jgi:hypothetical protein
MDASVKMELVSDLVKDWKMSVARGGARTALALAKVHYPERNLDIVTLEFRKENEDGKAGR